MPLEVKNQDRGRSLTIFSLEYFENGLVSSVFGARNGYNGGRE